jgi:hypothetical protein
MTIPHISQGTLDDCRDELHHGRPVESIAAILGCDAGYLARLLNLKPGPSPDINDPPADYLWSFDRLQEVL